MKHKYRIIFLCSLLIFALAVGYTAYYFAARFSRSRIYSRMQEQVIVSVSDTSEEVYHCPVSFSALQEINSDIYAWISVPGTDISYPIVQHPSDDSYYLNYTIEGHRGYPASIYTHTDTARDFSGFNSVIYGHNMKNGSMFGSLRNWRDENYLLSHREIDIYLPDRELIYTVFAAVLYDDRSINRSYDISDPAACEAFLESIHAVRDVNSHVLGDIPVSADDRIITLSTCVSGSTGSRYLLIAVLSDEIS